MDSRRCIGDYYLVTTQAGPRRLLSTDRTGDGPGDVRGGIYEEVGGGPTEVPVDILTGLEC